MISSFAAKNPVFCAEAAVAGPLHVRLQTADNIQDWNPVAIFCIRSRKSHLRGMYGGFYWVIANTSPVREDVVRRATGLIEVLEPAIDRVNKAVSQYAA